MATEGKSDTFQYKLPWNTSARLSDRNAESQQFQPGTIIHVGRGYFIRTETGSWKELKKNRAERGKWGYWTKKRVSDADHGGTCMVDSWTEICVEGAQIFKNKP